MIQVLLNGLVYQVPETGDENWGPNTTAYLVAIPTAVLQKSGGSFTLTAEVDFGASFGLKSIYFKSRSANPSGTGVVRLSASDTIGWKNQAGDGNVTLSKATDDSLAISSAGGLTASKVKSSTTDLILDAVTKLVLEKYALFAEQSTPATGPTIPSGYGSFYAGNDGKPYYKADSGSAIDLSNADVHGPNSSTDNAIATFSGNLGKTLQNTDLTVVTNGTEVDVNAIPDSADTGNALGLVLKAGVKSSGATSGDGGSASLIGGASNADSGNGGDAVLTGGDAVIGDAGSVNLNGGTTASGVGGDISMVPGSGTTRDGRIIAVGSFGSSITPADSFDIGSSSFRWVNGFFNTVDTDTAMKTPDLYLKNGVNTIQLVPATLSALRVITFPDVTGKIALTSATNGKTVLTDSVSGILPTANGGTGVNGSATFPSSGAVATVPGSGVVKSNGSVLSSANVILTSEVSGTLPIGNGGTGQTTKAPAFDALSPMSASGDLIYGGASGSGTRLAKGSDTQVLTLVSGLPSWQTPVTGFSNPMTTGGDIIYGGASGVATRLANGSSGQVLTSAGGTSAPTWASIFSSWSGHFESNSSWTRTNTSLGLPAIDSSATLTQEVNVNFNSVTAHNDGTPGNNYPGIVINPPSGTYEILVTIMIASGTSLAEARAGLTADGGSTYLDLKLVRMNTGGSTLYTVVTLVGHVTFSGASKNIDIYLASSSGACLIDPSTAGLNPYPIKWSIKRVG